MDISDELQKLDELRRSGVLSYAEFEIAKRRVLEGRQDTTHDQYLEDIKAQNQLAQLDREWELEREQYMIANKYGRYIPDKTSSVILGIALTGVGIAWTLFTGSLVFLSQTGFLFSIFPLFGVFWTLLAVGGSIYQFMKAEEYQKAYERYQSRRQKLINRHARR